MPRSTTRCANGLLIGGLALSMIAAGAGSAAAEPAGRGAVVQVIQIGDEATDLAWAWVQSMIESPTVVTTDSVVEPAETYDYSWTGPVSGTFDLVGVTPLATGEPAVVIGGNSATQSDTRYRGVVTGMLDVPAGYASSGSIWPAVGTYRDLEVVSFATTDATYRTGSVPAAADGTFSLASSSPGVKSFQLVQISSGEVLAEYRPKTGLVRSYGPESAIPATTFTYDQALALQSAMVLDDSSTAATLVQGLIRIQTTSGAQTGGFPAASPQLNPGGGDRQYFTGNHTVALYALTSYLRYADREPSLETPVRDAIAAGLAWLEVQRIKSGPRAGLYSAGWRNGALDWAAVEHNLDAWHALSLAAQILPCSQCELQADDLSAALRSVMWNPQNSRFDQGARCDGRDTVDPLDGNSWGAIFLTAIGDSAKADAALANAQNFAVSHGGTTGHLAYRPQPARPAPVPSVWVEGTAGVALAHARAGDNARQLSIVQNLRVLQQSNGSFPMATAADVNASLVMDTSVAATCWFILASLPSSPNSLWNQWLAALP